MKPATAYSVLVAMGAFLFLLLTVTAAPVEPDDETSENAIASHPDNDMEYPGWDAVNTAALRKLLLQLDAEDRMGRVSRSWPPQTEPRGWSVGGVREIGGRLARPWRADKRQVRFRQCYFNPISCFRK